jgi:hypothetical protein
VSQRAERNPLDQSFRLAAGGRFNRSNDLRHAGRQLHFCDREGRQHFGQSRIRRRPCELNAPRRFCEKGGISAFGSCDSDEILQALVVDDGNYLRVEVPVVDGGILNCLDSGFDRGVIRRNVDGVLSFALSFLLFSLSLFPLGVLRSLCDGHFPARGLRNAAAPLSDASRSMIIAVDGTHTVSRPFGWTKLSPTRPPHRGPGLLLRLIVKADR